MPAGNRSPVAKRGLCKGEPTLVRRQMPNFERSDYASPVA
jgi:hypothetical protein